MATSDASEQANRSGMDPVRLVVIFYLVFGFVLAFFFDHVLGQIWAAAAWRNPEVIEGPGWKVTSLLGFVMALAVVAGAYAHPRSKQLSLEVASELMKVTWPTFAETRVATFAVVVASLVAAVILYGMDVFSYNMMVEWLPRLWRKL